MENSIHIKKLNKTYKISIKEEGIKGSFKSLFIRKYKNVEAVKDISFTIKQGELVGFIGPNGAGKTTTLKMLSGLLYPTSGEINVLDYIPYKKKSSFLKSISLVMGQKNQLWSDLPAIETFNLHKEIYEIDDAQYKETLNELLDMLDLRGVIDQQVRKLSLGERMKCELLAALLHRPKILFLDEPTIGLDVVIQKKVREFLKEYNKKYNATIILTSHYMDDVKEVCDRIIMINHGNLVFDGKTDELIRKYANYKILIPIFNKEISEQELEKIGKIEEFNYPKAILTVPREDTLLKASELLAKFDIEDLNINEPKLEDIIRIAFEEKH